ncbi:hypothetical protein EZV73_25920 [Acidaminobacter sp. JC074]|uniref:helical backbone metal receptor n=1 Tax=Acidaminobacter sp. JC074 TaxID=2530199 RepID=UPI001F10ACAB|nr:helical backbone metal receptor [Acidaminobacter sp. JC074]MCH4891042.1 hypothetical protein [Acidaminobacter sp. JC074]
MRKLGILILVLSLVMVACQSGGGNTGSVSEKAEEKENVIEETTEEVNEMTEEVNEMTEEVPVVVAGTVSITNALYAVGVEIAAVPETSHEIPEDLLDLPRIGMSMTPDIEIVKSLEADYFFTNGMLKESLDASFTEQGIPVEYINMSTYDDVIETLTYFGEIFDKTENAESVIAEIRSYENQAKEIYEGKEAKTVAVIFGTPGSFMLTTSSAFTGELIGKVGAINVTDDMPGSMAPYIPFSLETLAEKDPDVILRLTHASPEESRKMFDEEFANNSFYSSLKAVKEGQVYDLDNNYFGVAATVKCGESLLEMAKLIYGN